MLSTSFVVAALSSGHKIGLAVVGGAFILFALVSSLVLPRRNPNFPGRGAGWYVLIGTLFLIAMLSAVIIFGREKKEAAGGEGSPPAHTTTSTAPAPGGAPGGSQGDAAAGKAVFTSAGCTNCHTLKDAGSTGTIGPNLDQLKPPFARVKLQVENGGGPMPAFKNTLSAKQIDDVSAYVASVAGK
jgi:cytochrome c6